MSDNSSSRRQGASIDEAHNSNNVTLSQTPQRSRTDVCVTPVPDVGTVLKMLLQTFQNKRAQQKFSSGSDKLGQTSGSAEGRIHKVSKKFGVVSSSFFFDGGVGA